MSTLCLLLPLASWPLFSRFLSLFLSLSRARAFPHDCRPFYGLLYGKDSIWPRRLLRVLRWLIYRDAPRGVQRGDASPRMPSSPLGDGGPSTGHLRFQRAGTRFYEWLPLLSIGGSLSLPLYLSQRAAPHKRSFNIPDFLNDRETVHMYSVHRKIYYYYFLIINLENWKNVNVNKSNF